MEFVPVFKWLLTVTVLTVIGAPIASVVFSRLPRRGATLSLPVSLVLVAISAFWIGQLRYGRETVIASVLLVAVLAAVAYRYGERPDWRAVATGYGVFLFGFVLYLLYASHDAAITPVGGEQFLHYGLTNGLMAADSLPPEDFWFAGKPIRYYYGTQLQVASLSLLSGVELRFGYYLGLATFYSVLFVSAYGLAGSVLAARDRSYHLGGLFGAFFVAVAGALTAFLRLAYNFLPDILLSKEAVFGALLRRYPTYAEAMKEQGTVEGWFWWNARYVIEGGLFEFPLYSFIKGDLHGHTLSTGYILLAAAVAYSYYRTPAESRLRRFGLLYGGLGAIAGLFGFMNTWALPSAVGLGWLALAAADAHPVTLLSSGRNTAIDTTGRLGRLGDETVRLVVGAVLALPIGIVGVLIASPFLFGGVPTNKGIGVLPPQSAFGQFVAVYGGLLLLFTVAVLFQARGSLDEQEWPVLAALGTVFLGLAVLPLVIDHRIAPDVLAVLGPLMLGAWLLVRTDNMGFEGVLLVGGLGLLLSMELVHAKVWPPQRVRWNTTLKVAVQGWTVAGAAAGVTGALLVSDALDQLATALGYHSRSQTQQPAGSLQPDGGKHDSQDTDDEAGSGGTGEETETFTGQSVRDQIQTVVPRPLRMATPALLVVLVVGAVVVTSLPFAVLSYGNNVDGDIRAYAQPGQQSIDALATHDRWHDKRMEAIYWLDRQGSPTIVEAPGRSTYKWRNAASVFSDAVTVAGWSHQSGYRGTETYDRRATAVEKIYGGPWSDAIRTLRKHDVEYIYVGYGEHEQFGSIRDFDDYSGVETAFSNRVVTIYRVNHSKLDPSDTEDGLPG